MAQSSMHFLRQIKQRRLSLNLIQQDMQARIGMTRQQYQRLEREGNPRLNTLALIAEGLNAELVLVPRDKLLAVRQLLAEDDAAPLPAADEDPWHGLLGEESDAD